MGGFGFGALLIFVGQKFSDAVTPAIVASMMPTLDFLVDWVLKCVYLFCSHQLLISNIPNNSEGTEFQPLNLCSLKSS